MAAKLETDSDTSVFCKALRPFSTGVCPVAGTVYGLTLGVTVYVARR